MPAQSKAPLIRKESSIFLNSQSSSDAHMAAAKSGCCCKAALKKSDAAINTAAKQMQIRLQKKTLKS